MRSKNTLQLSVLRSLLAEITNAQKTATPPKDDLGILAIINKTRSKSAVSIDEARAAAREDLVEKEQAQLLLLDAYADMVKTVGRDEIAGVVRRVVDALGQGERKMGDVIKAVSKELEGRPVVRAEVAGVVKEVLGGK
ncbi:Yqey-like protein-domain-containing protein [Sphaerosporella brunnea]|uniref:Altered inheritance of mitochondria protein 41 n=1 Tax=Sphaerosporella brunnea TaxID=1250544 RepID=A0A5J5EVY6_9PEZI|nr:Yqey-like protein-domain-containing protein [Sphaerosporella brunnea]